MRYAVRAAFLARFSLFLVVAGHGWAADFYVAAQDQAASDANPGTQAQPFRTLARACEAAGPGDTVYLRAGTYRETLTPARSGEPDRPVRFAAAPGEKVTLSSAEPLTGTWELHQGNLYRLTTPLRFAQLFVDGRMMLEARWPNSSPNDLMAPNRAAAGEGTDYEVLADSNLPPGDWNGALVLIWHGARWVSATRRVTEYQAGKSFRFDHDFRPKQPDKYHTSDPYMPRPGNPYILIGSLAGLDSPGEWFLDESTGVVYLWAPDGDEPSRHSIEVKQRDFACDLSKLSYIRVEGLDIVAAGVNMTDAQDCVLERCRLRYIDYTREPSTAKEPRGNIVTGKNNEWRNCLVAYAAGAGIRLAGEGNRLVNCVVHDVDYLGTGTGGLDLTSSVGAKVLHCSVFRTGRDTIRHHGSQRIRLEYNDIYLGNMLNNDAGGIYCWGTDGQGGIIAHNWVHDHLGDNTCGIYLDNFSRYFFVYNNVIWNCTGSGIRLNSDATNHLVCNNTITQTRQPFGTYCYHNYTPTMKGTRIVNNLVNALMDPRDPAQFVQGDLAPELHHNSPGAVDRDGVPVKGSGAIDAGVEIPGITDGYVGRAPDLGAYEYGGERWVAGADWNDPEAPPPPARDLSFSPRGPVTEDTMIADGLLLWLDANDATTLDLGPNNAVLAWRDKSPAKRVVQPDDPTRTVSLVTNALNSRPVVRGTGVGRLRIGTLRDELGPVTALVITQGLEAVGPPWQRIMACFTGDGQEWVLPNWILLRPGGEKPEAYPARLFIVQHRRGAALAGMTLLGASANKEQCLAGDVAEVLVFGRELRFDEFNALVEYLRTKWGLAD